MRDPGRDLRALPKAHLHIHLEGGMRRDTLNELAARYGETPPVVPFGADFGLFESGYRTASSLLRSPSDLERLVMELAEDAAESGAAWIEPSAYVTDARAKVSGTETESDYLEVLLDAAAAAQHATGVGIGFMLAANRAKPLQEAMDMAILAARYSGPNLVGFGLMGNEALAPPEPFADAFAVARRAELLSVPHAGELDGPNSVQVAIDALAAARIQHGVRAIEDPALCERLSREAVCLDICPTSNCFLSVVENLREHPLPALLAAGVSVSINADDPLFFGSTLLDEYELCRSEFGLDDAALAAIAATSIRASGAPDDLKASALAGIRRWLVGPPPAIP